MSGSTDMVPSTEEYWEFVRSLRNDPILKKGFVDQKHINKEDHYKYMQIHHKDYFICLENNLPVGFVGCVKDDIRVAVLKSHSGQGLGKKMIKHIMALYPLAQAKVKINNKASIKLFESCGFEKKFYLMEPK